jgi:outer membrane protein OmpA-like peptidoglycan-associated protein
MQVKLKFLSIIFCVLLPLESFSQKKDTTKSTPVRPKTTKKISIETTVITKKIFSLAKSIYFKTNSDEITIASHQTLNRIADLMKKYPKTHYTIDGYSDSRGEANYNKVLSQKRADNVSVYLRNKGVPNLNVYSIGHGEENAMNSNETEEGRKLNRKVEINFIIPDSEREKEIEKKQTEDANKDTDNDGVVDLYDQEKDTPKDALVYSSGIAVDSDKDGIPDHEDLCPLLAGPKKEKGCPTDKKLVDLKDDDGDGVINEFDKEPNTPKNTKVYGNGKAVDTDDDGIADYKDECPCEFGTTTYKGCPQKTETTKGKANSNTSNTVVITPVKTIERKKNLSIKTTSKEKVEKKKTIDASSESKTINKTKESVEDSDKNSDKDSDGDGVLDIHDKEPNTPAGAKVYLDGIAVDTDRDNIPDYKDKCPRVKGIPENSGCPKERDSDGDGVGNSFDFCPTVKGSVNNNGCPDKEFDKGAYSTIEELAKKIKFAPKKNLLTPTTKNILQQISDILKEYPGTSYEIKGHTDDKSNEKYSLFLSKRRAKAIRDYMVYKKIRRERLTYEGYGETQPKFSNTGDLETSQRNNRIEFIYQEK